MNLNKPLTNFDAIIITYGNWTGTRQVDEESQFILVTDLKYSDGTIDNQIGDRYLLPKASNLDYRFLTNKQSFYIFGRDKGASIFKITGIKF